MLVCRDCARPRILSTASSQVAVISMSSRSRRSAPWAHCSARANRNIHCRRRSSRSRSSSDSCTPARYSSELRGRCSSDCKVDFKTATGVLSSCAALPMNSRCCTNERSNRSSIAIMESVKGRNSVVCSASAGMGSSQFRAETSAACAARRWSGNNPRRIP